MAGRRRSNSRNSADWVVGILILFAIGWVISHWKEVLFFVALVGVAVGIYFMLKQFRKKLIEKRIDSEANLQNVTLPRPIQSVTPAYDPHKWGMSKYELGKLDEATLNEVIAARLDATAKDTQQVIQRFASLPVVETNHKRKKHSISPKTITTQITPASTSRPKILNGKTEPLQEVGLLTSDEAVGESAANTLGFGMKTSKASEHKETTQATAQFENNKRQEFIPRTAPMKPEEIEAKIRKLEEIIRS